MHSDAPLVATVATILIFIPTVAAFIVLLRRTLPSRRTFRICGSVALGLLALQCAVSASGFYADFEATPPRFPLAVVPSMAMIGVFCWLAWRNRGLSIKSASAFAYFQSFRLPLEIFVLHELYKSGLMPPHITYEGVNFDVLVGLTALGIGWYASRPNPNRAILRAWNIWGIASLMIIITVAISSLPTAFQRISLDQPNLAPAHFPFILLPAFFVPAALWGHILSLIALARTTAGAEI